MSRKITQVNHATGLGPRKQDSETETEPELPPAVLLAMKQKWDAIRRSQASDKFLNANSSDPEVYDWLKEEGEVTLLKLDTWLKYQQRGRKFLKQPKSSPSGGRPKGPSIVDQDGAEQTEAD